MKRILVIAEDEVLRNSRVSILELSGYEVLPIGSNDAAMALLEIEKFDLIIIGRDLQKVEKQIDQRLRERYPDLKTLKIQLDQDVYSVYPTRTVDSPPVHVVAAAVEMLME